MQIFWLRFGVGDCGLKIGGMASTVFQNKWVRGLGWTVKAFALLAAARAGLAVGPLG